MTDSLLEYLPRHGRPLARAAFVAGALLLVAACTETSLNDAPVIDRSVQPHASMPLVRPGTADTGAAPSAAADVYTVQKGDTLFHIAAAYHATVHDLAVWNAIEETTPIYVGQRLRVRAVGAAPEAVAAPVATADADAPVAAEVRAVPLVASGSLETRPLAPDPVGPAPAGPAQAGAGVTPGAGAASLAPAAVPAAAVPAAPTTAPGDSATVAAGTPAPPAPGALVATAPAAADPAKPAAATRWVWPAEGRIIVQFDPAHSKGIDIAVAENAPIVAVADGEVSYTGSPRDYGNLVILHHPDGLLSVYAHNKAILVKQGQPVTRGQNIATGGKVGGAPAILHFEVRRTGNPVNPLDLLPAR